MEIYRGSQDDLNIDKPIKNAPFVPDPDLPPNTLKQTYRRFEVCQETIARLIKVGGGKHALKVTSEHFPK